MHVFFDESGRALTPEKKPVACVAALIVPDKQVDELNKWFIGIERENDEPIKERKLDFPLVYSEGTKTKISRKEKLS